LFQLFSGKFVSYFALDFFYIPHLKLPPLTKQFLISPPASPPLDWEPVHEAEPVINFDLLHAMASLAPGML
jgi:hypothetical protein